MEERRERETGENLKRERARCGYLAEGLCQNLGLRGQSAELLKFLEHFFESDSDNLSVLIILFPNRVVREGHKAAAAAASGGGCISEQAG